MAQSNTSKTEALLRFANNDESVTYEQRGLFCAAARKEVKDVSVGLNDARDDTRIVKGAEGLDVQGFTYVHHRSALQDTDGWLSGQNIEDVYISEVCDLVCKVTGAKKAIVNNTVFRSKLVNHQLDPFYYIKKGDPLDIMLGNIPRDKAQVMGREEGTSLEPIRGVHVDYTEDGLRNTVRECRKDIAALGKTILDAEDAKSRGEDVTVPRYAAYVVWRPLETVKRDPLVVCDYRTIEKETLSKHKYRCTSEQNENGEYIMEYWNVDIPNDPKQAQWYWMSKQTPEDVLIAKLADTTAETDSSVARCGAHSSADVKGTENEEIRKSIECRVIAFWE